MRQHAVGAESGGEGMRGRSTRRATFKVIEARRLASIYHFLFDGTPGRATAARHAVTLSLIFPYAGSLLLRIVSPIPDSISNPISLDMLHDHGVL